MNKYRKLYKKDESIKIIKKINSNCNTIIKRQETLPDEISTQEEILETLNFEINTTHLSTNHIS